MIKTEESIIQKIKNRYVEHETTKLDELKALDKKARRPAEVFSYIFGSIGSLVLGSGMCMAMKVIFAGWQFVMPVGIAIGLVGIAMVSANYFMYKKILSSRKRKYANKVLTLSDEILQR